MSMDLEVWSESAFEIPSWLPFASEWASHHGEWSLERDGWHLLVSSEEADEIPPEVAEKLPGARYRAGVILEPIGADDAGYTLLEATVRGLALKSHGVWVNPDGDVLGSADI